MNTTHRDRDMMQALAVHLNKKPSQIAADIGVAASTLTRVASGTSRLSVDTTEKLHAAYPDFFGNAAGTPAEGDLPDYVEVEVLPSFVGAGGGGFGEGEPGRAMIPRVLVEERLRGRAGDFLMVDVRGDSMEPDFFHGDQILIDRRDTNPTQPGPFALFDGDAYVVKLIERVPMRRGKLRVFSANDRYSAYEIGEDEAQLLGRPVWLGRAL
jgi:phage repressor protein C with HTH and peptisase S24 domain